jgi:DNA-binding transcriptional MocR family regulator
MMTVSVRYPITGSGATEIAGSVERAIADGSLAPGASLPAIRELACALGVNPNTVAAAYRMLRDRGAVETGGRRGTWVRDAPATMPRCMRGVPVAPGARDLASGGPNVRLLPDPRRVGAPAHPPVTYGDEEISPLLSTLASKRLRADGVPSGRIITTFGGLDAMERTLGAHLRNGDRVAVEDPGWGNLFDLVAALGLTPEPIRLDDDGPLPEDMAAALERGVRAVIVSGRAQNPTGASISQARARQLRAVLARRPSLLVIEDDPAADVAGTAAHPVVGTTSHWAYVRSMSKAYGPDLRLALLCGDPLTTDRVQGRLRLGAGWVSRMVQDIVTAYWQDAGVGTLVATANRDYANRRTALVDALGERGVVAHGRSGMNVWVPVPDEAYALGAMLAAGFCTAPGSRFRLSSPPGIRVTISTLTAAEVTPLADAIAAAARPAATRRGI